MVRSYHWSKDMNLANTKRWWWTGKPVGLQSMGSQRIRHNWATELNWADSILRMVCFSTPLLLLVYLFLAVLCLISVRKLSYFPGAGTTLLTCGAQASHCSGLSFAAHRLFNVVSVVVVRWFSYSSVCGILPDQVSNLWPLYWQPSSQPLDHPASPCPSSFRRLFPFSFIINIFLDLTLYLFVIQLQGMSNLTLLL